MENLGETPERPNRRAAREVTVGYSRSTTRLGLSPKRSMRRYSVLRVIPSSVAASAMVRERLTIRHGCRTMDVAAMGRKAAMTKLARHLSRTA